MDYYFHSHYEEYRSPFGAVAENTPVGLRICLPRCWGCHEATLLVEEDGKPLSRFGMFWAGMEGDDREWWDVHFTPEKAGVYFYCFELELALGKGWLVRQPDGSAVYSYRQSAPAWQLTCYEKGFATPDWLAGGVMYQIFPDRFYASGTPKEGVPDDRRMHASWEEPVEWRADEQGEIRNNDYFGGDLQGIAEKLPYLAKLGVTCVYLNPIFEAHSNHRYNTADYEHIDPLLGTTEDFRRLTEQGKQWGIAVLLDGVFSHTGDDSRYFNKWGRYPTPGAYQSPDSPYASWYRFRTFPTDYCAWWGFKTLPEVEELSPGFMDFINGETGIVSRWMQEGACGWRLDVADELPDGFLEALRRRVKAENPQGLVLGEVWEDASTKESYGHRRRYLLGQQLDSVMNYPFRSAVLMYLTQGDEQRFFNEVMGIAENYPPQVLRLLMNVLGTHDTERALTLLAGEPANRRGREWQSAQRLSREQRDLGKKRLRLGALMQYTLPGVPCIYYGDEAGMEGYRDPFNRQTFPWGNADGELTAWYELLGALRRNCQALKEGRFIPCTTPENTLCYIRQGEEDALLVAVNRSGTEQRIPLGEEWQGLVPALGDGVWQDGCLWLSPYGCCAVKKG